MSPIRLMLVTDHLLFRDGLAALAATQSDLYVEAAVANEEEAIEILTSRPIDVIVLDLRHPESAFRTLSQARQEPTNSRVLVLYNPESPRAARDAIRRGAAGCLPWTAPAEEWFRVIRAVHHGQVDMDPHWATGAASPEPEDVFDVLSPRERQVLRLLAQRLSNQRIADLLCVGVKSVESYRHRISEKLGVHDREELIRFAIEHGWGRPDD